MEINNIFISSIYSPSFSFLVSSASPPALLSSPIVYPHKSAGDMALSFNFSFILFLNSLFLFVFTSYFFPICSSIKHVFISYPPASSISTPLSLLDTP